MSLQFKPSEGHCVDNLQYFQVFALVLGLISATLSSPVYIAS